MKIQPSRYLSPMQPHRSVHKSSQYSQQQNQSPTNHILKACQSHHHEESLGLPFSWIILGILLAITSNVFIILPQFMHLSSASVTTIQSLREKLQIIKTIIKFLCPFFTFTTIIFPSIKFFPPLHQKLLPIMFIAL